MPAGNSPYGMPGGMRQARQEMQIQPIKVEITDTDIYMHPKLERDMQKMVYAIQRKERFGPEMKVTGLFMHGPPGTGKSLYAKWLAYKADAALFPAPPFSHPEQVMKFFAAARQWYSSKKQPVIIWVDEVEKVGSRDDIVDPTMGATLNQLLTELSGTGSNEGIYIVGTTNRPDKVDIALRRPERFGKEVYFMPPDERGRYEILKIHASTEIKKHQFEVLDKDLKELAKQLYGYTGGDLKGVLTEAYLSANLADRTKVAMEDLMEGVRLRKPSAIRDMPFREPKIKLDDLVGYQYHKDVLRRIFSDSEPDLVLFYGPDGNGKTKWTEAIAGEHGWNYIVVSASEPEHGIVGRTGEKIDTYFDRAQQLAPSLLVFDKVDALVEKKGRVSWQMSWTGRLEARLSEKREGVSVIATLCDPELITDTFIGVFTHKILFDYPTKEDQVLLWNHFSKHHELDYMALAEAANKRCQGRISVRDIEYVCRCVHDFGIETELKKNKNISLTDIYLNLLNEHTPESFDLNTKELVRKYGDSVTKYRQIFDMLHSKEKRAEELVRKEKTKGE